MSSENHITTETAWNAWKAACAADLCDDSTAAMLRRFGVFAFQSQLKKYASQTGHDSSPMLVTESKDGWHLFETHSQVSKNRMGKRYKDWLFLRAPEGGDWLAAVEGGAVLLMRDVVREYLRREHAPSFMTSMNKPVGDAQCTLEDLLPDELDVGSEIERREWLALAKLLAASCFSILGPRERIALWARASGRGLHDKDVLKRASCGKSVLYDAHRKAIENICATIKQSHPDEPASVLTHLASLVLSELGYINQPKRFPEKEAAGSYSNV